MRFETLESTPSKDHPYLDADRALFYVYDTVKHSKSLGAYTRRDLADKITDQKNKEYLETWFAEVKHQDLKNGTIDQEVTENSLSEDVITQQAGDL
jgi:hypothetical protein